MRLASSSVTVIDVARAAGVSHNTVALSLRDDPRVREETKTRVRAIAEQLGYRANAAAKSLVRKTVPYVGLINAMGPAALASSASQLMRSQTALLVELGRCLGQHGLHLVVSNEEPYVYAGEQARHEVPQILLQRQVSGVLALNDIWPGLYQEVQRFNLPCVAVHTEPTPGIHVVSVDHERGAEAAVKYLVDLGHRAIACIPGSKDGPSVKRKTMTKVMGYLSAMAAAGLTPISGWDSEVKGVHVNAVGTLLPQLFDRPDCRPTAILVYDDVVAIKAIDYLRNRGLRVPQDISVISLEDDNIGDVACPSVTTVGGSSWRRLAEAAVSILVDLMQGKTVRTQQVSIRPELVVRESSAALPAA